MKDSELFKQLEHDTEMLRMISENYAATSPEQEALRRAALALTYVVMNARNEFRTFLDEIDTTLSDEERAELRDRYEIDD